MSMTGQPDDTGLLPEEMMDDGAWLNIRQWEKAGNDRFKITGTEVMLTGEARQKMHENGVASQKKRMATLKARKLKATEIRRMAFEQEDIRLSDELTKERVRRLIYLLTGEHRRMMGKYRDYVNRRLTELLGPMIPKKLRAAYALFPVAVKKCPGFIYRASEDFGGGHIFWAVPDIPYYFTQGSENSILRERKQPYLFRIDKAVAAYEDHRKKLELREITIASKIIDAHVITYFDLLKLDAFWFEALYADITGKKLTWKENDL